MAAHNTLRTFSFYYLEDLGRHFMERSTKSPASFAGGLRSPGKLEEKQTLESLPEFKILQFTVRAVISSRLVVFPPHFSIFSVLVKHDIFLKGRVFQVV